MVGQYSDCVRTFRVTISLARIGDYAKFGISTHCENENSRLFEISTISPRCVSCAASDAIYIRHGARLTQVVMILRTIRLKGVRTSGDGRLQYVSLLVALGVLQVVRI